MHYAVCKYTNIICDLRRFHACSGDNEKSRYVQGGSSTCNLVTGGIICGALSRTDETRAIIRIRGRCMLAYRL